MPGVDFSLTRFAAKLFYRESAAATAAAVLLMKSTLVVVFAAAAALLVSGSVPTASGQTLPGHVLVGDYKLTGDLSDSLTTGALPSLSPVGVAANVSFTPATVNGSSRQVLRLNNTLAVASTATTPVSGDGGVQVNTFGLVNPSDYSVVLDLSLDAQVVGKLIDVTNLSQADAGLYADNGALYLQGSNGTPGVVMSLPAVDTFFELTLTCDASGTNVYVNGTLALTSNTVLQFMPVQSTQELSLFKADSQRDLLGTGEPIQGLTGDLAEVRVYTVPEPGAVSALLLGAAALGLGVLCRGRQRRCQ